MYVLDGHAVLCWTRRSLDIVEQTAVPHLGTYNHVCSNGTNDHCNRSQNHREGGKVFQWHYIRDIRLSCPKDAKWKCGHFCCRINIYTIYMLLWFSGQPVLLHSMWIDLEGIGVRKTLFLEGFLFLFYFSCKKWTGNFRLDAQTSKRYEQINLPGRPKKWKQRAFEVMENAIVARFVKLFSNRFFQLYLENVRHFQSVSIIRYSLMFCGHGG